MRRTLLWIAMLLVFASCAHASSAKIHFVETMTLDSNVFPAGEYWMQWTGFGDRIEVEFGQGRKKLGVFPAIVRQADNRQFTARTDDGVVIYSHNTGVAEVIFKIRLSSVSFFFSPEARDEP